VSVVDALGGVARRDQILSAGLSGTDITAAVRRGELRRVRRAHYASRRAQPDAVVAARVGGRLAGLSAARSYGLWGGFDERCHVVVATNASRLRLITTPDATTPDVGERDVVVHWQDVGPRRECWRVGLLDALRQVVAWADQETAMAVLDTALDLGVASKAQLSRAFADESTTSRIRAAAAAPGSGSGYESMVVRRLRPPHPRGLAGMPRRHPRRPRTPSPCFPFSGLCGAEVNSRGRRFDSSRHQPHKVLRT
jgi:hypothetical protein